MNLLLRYLPKGFINSISLILLLSLRSIAFNLNAHLKFSTSPCISCQFRALKDLWKRFGSKNLNVALNYLLRVRWVQLLPAFASRLYMSPCCRTNPHQASLPLPLSRKKLPQMAERSHFFELQTSLYGRLLQSHNPDRRLVRNIIKDAMAALGVPNVKPNPMGNDTYRLEFGSVPIARAILEASPWVFLKSPLALTPADPEATVEELDFSKVPFWVQLHGVPLGRLTSEDALILGARIGEVCVPETRADRLNKWRGFLRVRVLLDMAQPLSPGFYLYRDNREAVWVRLKYERLQEFCYRCGRINHTERTCTFPERNRDPDDKKNLTAWMKAVPLNKFQLPPASEEGDEQSDGGHYAGNHPDRRPEAYRTPESSDHIRQEHASSFATPVSPVTSTGGSHIPDIAAHYPPAPFENPDVGSQPDTTPDAEQSFRTILLHMKAEAKRLGQRLEDDPRFWAVKDFYFQNWARFFRRPTQEYGVGSSSQGAQYYVQFPDDSDTEDGAQIQTEDHFAEQNTDTELSNDPPMDDAIVLSLHRLTLKRNAVEELEFADTPPHQLNPHQPQLYYRRKKARISHSLVDAAMGSAAYIPDEEEAPQGPPQEP